MKNRPLYIPPNNPQMDSVPPAEQSEGYNGSAIAHFHEKSVNNYKDLLAASTPLTIASFIV